MFSCSFYLAKPDLACVQYWSAFRLCFSAKLSHCSAQLAAWFLQDTTQLVKHVLARLHGINCIDSSHACHPVAADTQNMASQRHQTVFVIKVKCVARV